jgi:hypothetical protein
MNVSAPNVSHIQEMVPGVTPQLVWQMHVSSLLYRGFRIPSLYPGVTWSADAIAAANVPAVAKKDKNRNLGGRWRFPPDEQAKR